ncbi:MAG TPA: hypothetical protein H9803_02215, partial [Candidatus Ligilactobacillus excrementavium]|nr:hypothetical protein [Candidatus Ligilactobacillus excrementavium]
EPHSEHAKAIFLFPAIFQFSFDNINSNSIMDDLTSQYFGRWLKLSKLPNQHKQVNDSSFKSDSRQQKILLVTISSR